MMKKLLILSMILGLSLATYNPMYKMGMTTQQLAEKYTKQDWDQTNTQFFDEQTVLSRRSDWNGYDTKLVLTFTRGRLESEAYIFDTTYLAESDQEDLTNKLIACLGQTSRSKMQITVVNGNIITFFVPGKATKVGVDSDDNKIYIFYTK